MACGTTETGEGKAYAATESGKPNINDDAGLEHEADVMGTKALQTKADDARPPFARHMMAHADTTQLEGGNRVTETVKYGLGGLMVGAGLCWLIQQRPDIAGNTLLKLASVFLPTFLGGLKGYWEGAKLDEDEEEWKNLQPLAGGVSQPSTAKFGNRNRKLRRTVKI